MICQMKKYLCFLIFTPATAFAAAGFADAYHDHQHWIFPAYAYCLVFGLITLLLLAGASLIWKAKTQTFALRISSYLVDHKIAAIIFTGLLLAIPIGIIGNVLWEIIWFLSILPVLCMMVAFPLILVNRKFREKCLLSQFWIKWSLMITASIILASLLFIIFTNCDLLPGTDITYLARPDRYHRGFYSPTHPYDSMLEIWGISFFFIGEIIIATILYWLGIINRTVCKRLSELRRRKRETFDDIYKEDL